MSDNEIREQAESFDWPEADEIPLANGSAVAVIVTDGQVRLTVTATNGTRATIAMDYAVTKALTDSLTQAAPDAFRAEHAARQEARR